MIALGISAGTFLKCAIYYEINCEAKICHLDLVQLYFACAYSRSTRKTVLSRLEKVVVDNYAELQSDIDTGIDNVPMTCCHKSVS